MAHAILSASGAHKWMNCPPSARLEEHIPSKQTEYTLEGTLAHSLGEITLRKELEEITTRKFNSELKKIEADKLYTADMPDYVGIYVDTCMEKVAEAKATTPDAVFKVEQRLDFSKWVPDGFGTGDFVVIADGTMEICDLKYGKGVPVSAKNNPQMMLYALGAINEFSFLYDIEKVRMTIIQPRLDSISSFELTADELLDWGEKGVKPIAELAFKGEGEFQAGEHCGFCRAKCTCKARAEKNLELAKYEFRSSPELSTNDISDILGRVDELVKWASDIKEYALEQALQGVKYEGFKVVEGRSNRKYADQETVAKILSCEYDAVKIYKPIELLGITAMEKVVGKKKLVDLVGDYIIKPPGKACLAPVSDKRPIYNPLEIDFGRD